MQGSGYYALWGKPSGQADTYCMVNVFLQRHSKRGYESIWIYPVCCDYVWTGMHAAFDSGICIQTAGWCDGICFHQVSPTDEVQIVVFGVFWRAAWCHHVWTFRWRLRTFSWRTTFLENFFLDVDGENDVFGNRLEFVLPRIMYLLDNNNFQTALYFKPFLHDDVFGEGFGEKRLFSGLAFFCRTLERCICNICKCMWMWMSLFSFIYFSWNLQQTLENNVHVCTYLVQACCTTE